MSRAVGTRARRTTRAATTRLGLIATLATAAAALPAAAVGAQQATTVRAATALTPQAELEGAQRTLAALERRMSDIVASLGGREPTPQAMDSLLRYDRERRALLNRVALLQSRLRFRALEAESRRQASPGAQPQGWFGVVTTANAEAGVSSGGQVVVTSEYPLVNSVEPGSPAARAGLQAGDRLVTIRGQDMRALQHAPTELARLLRPGTTLPVRIVREGKAQTVTVAITNRPTTFATSEYQFNVVDATTGETRRLEPTRVRVTTASPSVTVEGTAVRAAPSPMTYLLTTDASVMPVAGAEVMTVTAGLRSTRGVERGLYVLSVMPRTPAESAGLLAGDVLVRANGTVLTQPKDFLLVVQRANGGDQRVRIELVRAKQERTVEMKW
jgi:S1-C subfamily serine protease